VDWTAIYTRPAGTGSFSGSITGLPGYYTVYVQVLCGGVQQDVTSVTKIGIGEVFITAGQSNSTNYGDTTYTPTDDRVNALNMNTGAWVAAADPQPPFADGTQGSIWSRLGDDLASYLNMPIGFVSIGQGNTFSSQWASPSGTYYPRITQTVQSFPINGFRALLWQQGENDASTGVSTATYYGNVSTTITQSRIDAGWALPWLIARSSYYTTPDPANQAQIQAAYAELITNLPPAHAGADTDTLTGANRNGPHFTDTGLSSAATLWKSAIATAFGI
jgi:hypothetical protein